MKLCQIDVQPSKVTFDLTDLRFGGYGVVSNHSKERSKVSEYEPPAPYTTHYTLYSKNAHQHTRIIAAIACVDAAVLPTHKLTTVYALVTCEECKNRALRPSGRIVEVHP